MYLNIASHVVILEVYTGAATTEIDVENMGMAFAYKIHFALDC